MRDFVRKPANWFVVMIVVAVLAALIISFFQSANSQLPSYTPGTVVEPKSTPEATKPPVTIRTQPFSSDAGFTMEVPADWSYVLKGGKDTFVNATDGAKVVFTVSDYNPALNLVSKETVEADAIALNGVLGAYVQYDDHTYAALYEIGTVDYFELSTWSLDTVVRVSIQIPAERYTHYHDDMLYLLDTFSWEPLNPIPEGYSIYYSEYGNFEFLIPEGWQYEIVDGALVAADTVSGGNFRVSLSGNASDLSSISQIDYVNAMSPGKTAYMLSTFSNNGQALTAEANFTANNIAYSEFHSITYANAFRYEFLFQVPQEYESKALPQFLTAIQHFRVF